MRLALITNPTFAKKQRFSPELLFLTLIITAFALLACNPFGGDDDADLEGPSAEVVEVSRDSAEVDPEGATQDNQVEPAAETPPTSTPEPPDSTAEEPSASETVPTVASGTADEARNLAWAYLSQCVALSISELEAREIQGEWFVQAAGESPDKYGLWKVDPAVGLVQPHNIRARQWEPLVNQDCTPALFSGFFTPTPSPLLNANVTEASQAVTTLWATLINCYPNMRTSDLDATLNQAQGEWVVTTRPEINTNYGVWAVASDGTVSPKNRQAQGVFEQLDTGLC